MTDNQAGWTIIAIVVACLGLMFYGAYKADQANGISISQSLKNNGF